MTQMTPDVQLQQRLQKAIETRNKARDGEIRLRAAVQIAQEQADEAARQALELFGVSSIEALQSLATVTYKKNLDDVEAFEAAVEQYVRSVQEAEKLLCKN